MEKMEKEMMEWKRKEEKMRGERDNLKERVKELENKLKEKKKR